MVRQILFACINLMIKATDVWPLQCTAKHPPMLISDLTWGAIRLCFGLGRNRVLYVVMLCSFICVLEWIVAYGEGSSIDFISLLSLLRGCTVGCRQLQTAFSWSLKYEIAISPCNAFIMIPCAFVQCGIFHQTMDWNKQGKILIGYLMQKSARKKSCHRRQEEIRSQPGWELKLLWKHYSIYVFESVFRLFLRMYV